MSSRLEIYCTFPTKRLRRADTLGEINPYVFLVQAGDVGDWWHYKTFPNIARLKLSLSAFVGKANRMLHKKQQFGASGGPSNPVIKIIQAKDGATWQGNLEEQYAKPGDLRLPRTWEDFPRVTEDPRGGSWEGVWERQIPAGDYEGDEFSWEEVPPYGEESPAGWACTGPLVAHRDVVIHAWGDGGRVVWCRGGRSRTTHTLCRAIAEAIADSEGRLNA